MPDYTKDPARCCNATWDKDNGYRHAPDCPVKLALEKLKEVDCSDLVVPTETQFDFKSLPPEGDLSFTYQDPKTNEIEEYLRFEPGGKVFIRGELVDDNAEVYKRFLEWFTKAEGKIV